MSDWQSIGQHRYRLQDEVLQFEPHGALSLPEAKAWLDILGSHFERQPRGFLLVDARAIKPPNREIRRMFLSLLRERKLRPHIVGFGMNALVRAVSRIVVAAARHLLGLDLDVALYATESEARSHLDRVRRSGQPAAAQT
jgi:hypothetical protein